MKDLGQDSQDRKTAVRRGFSGEGDRPWVAVWLVLLERAQQAAGHSPARKAHWKAALGNFLLQFRRHPGRIEAAEIRNWLFQSGEVGSLEGPRSLLVAMDSLAFFYTAVVPRPLLAEAARHPFESHPGWLRVRGLSPRIRENPWSAVDAGALDRETAVADWLKA